MNKKIIQSYSVVQLVIQRSWLMQSMKHCQKISDYFGENDQKHPPSDLLYIGF